MRDDRELDALVSALNLETSATVEDTPSDAGGTLRLWLRRVRELDGSDLLLVAGAPPTVRVAGDLSPISSGVLDGDDVEAAVLPHASASLRSRYGAGEAIDLAITLPGQGRFRVNLHRERGRPGAAI